MTGNVTRKINMKLTQRQLDNISSVAYDLKNTLSDTDGRMNGQSVYVGEDAPDVFLKCNELTGAPKGKVKQLHKTLNRISSLLNAAEQLAEEIEFWADDAEPT